MVNDLRDAGLDDVEMLLEYQLPLTSKRADVVLCGTHPRTGNSSYVVLELKQWTEAMLKDGTDDVVSIGGYGDHLHPGEQVRRYCVHLTDFVASLADEPHRVTGAAYLHNATDLGVDGLFQLPATEQSRVFTGQGRGTFVDFLRTKLAPESGAAAADELLNAAVRPSKQLMALAAEEVQQREMFNLLDEQQVAYSEVLRAVEASRRGNTKEVIVVTGGPGSGKSVIALSLLGELSRRGRPVLHATGSSAFTQSLRRIAGSRAPRVQQMFKYYNQFIDAEKNGLDVLILDEAHRIKETSTNRYTRASLRTGRPQVEELIDAARVPVFLLDEHQVVRPSERGTVAEIEGAALRMECKVTHIDLDGQFRCGGSRVYEMWVLRLLGLEPGGPIRWEGDDGFELSAALTPSTMELKLAKLLDEGYSARMAAGYCWKWRDPEKGSDSLPEDVVIGDWSKPWNNKRDTSFAGAPGTPYWATDPAGFNQVGCVYTAQGFEYDYGGVIIGPDLVWRTDEWVVRPEYNQDTQLKRGNPTGLERAILNTYKVLLTRSMRGTSVFSTDHETNEMLQRLVRA
ncbi:DUF2075 domain-containing protein [Nocardioides sp. AX2bis]|uniref:DUF2075 domain-containing protein n=1 Tax=Nocardioides sp. AX2bis TaxID=2653157 RepID=UPI0012F24B5A|nr:DUF2075 domain-containing protein [Nocardioides sp. AX2bis]VXB44824.1 conserved hypothetical protein [Nocardioides sp. AX2bis]